MAFTQLQWLSDELLTVDGTNFRMSMTDFSLRTDEERVVLLKDRRMVDGYCDLFQNREIQNIVEFGIFEGGSPILFAAATSARKIISFDIRDRVTAVEAHARKFGDRVKLVYNTSQVDRAEIYRVVDEELGEQPIDLVIDDASHDYNLTKKCFEIVFPRLAIGGIYVIEDWAWAHFKNTYFDEYWHDRPALSNLAVDLALAVGSETSVAKVEILDWCLVVTKGAPTPPDFTLDAIIRLSANRQRIML